MCLQLTTVPCKRDHAESQGSRLMRQSGKAHSIASTSRRLLGHSPRPRPQGAQGCDCIFARNGESSKEPRALSVTHRWQEYAGYSIGSPIGLRLLTVPLPRALLFDDLMRHENRLEEMSQCPLPETCPVFSCTLIDPGLAPYDTYEVLGLVAPCAQCVRGTLKFKAQGAGFAF